MSRLDLSIVVLQWNRSDLTQACVESVRNHTDADYELIIVDNGSDAEGKALARDHADRPVLLDTNLGFAGGMNAGLDVATAPMVAFVNNDTTVPEHWASRLLETARDHRVGIAVPVVSSAGNVSTVRSEPGRSVIPARPFVDLPSGVVYLLAADTIRSLGGWATDYEMASAEDLDLLFATWVIGLEVAIDERVFVEHVGSASASQLRGKGRIWSANRKRFAATWSTMDETAFRSRYGWRGQISPERLSEARVAAYWMGRLFDVADAARTGAAVRPPAVEKGAGPARPTRRWWRRTTDID